MVLKQFDVFFKDRRMDAKSFRAHTVKEVIATLRYRGVPKSKIKQIQSEGKIVRF